jgi:cobalamin biosynthesis protein CbiD
LIVKKKVSQINNAVLVVNAESRGIKLEIVKEDFNCAAIKRAIRQFERINIRGAEFDNSFAAQCFSNRHRVRHKDAIAPLRRSRSKREKNYRNMKRKPRQMMDGV